MKTQSKHQRYCYSIFISILCLSLENTAYSEQCSAHPSEAPVIETCVSDEGLSIKGETFRHDYNYGDYTASLSDLISTWAQTAPLEDKDFCGLDANIILSVPELNPEGYALRVIVDHNRGPIMFNLPGNPFEWTVNEVAPHVFKEGETYPNSYGYIAGSLIAKAANNNNLNSISDFLRPYGASVDIIRTNWYNIQLPIFNELLTLEKIKQNPSFQKYFSSITMNSSYEWISHKGTLTSFVITCN
jgi:hypothetical protein